MRPDEKNHQGEVVLVTGASSGIGRACAQLLAGRGYRVYGTSRREIEIEGIRMLRTDVTDTASVNAAIDRILAEAGKIDAVVNNAGFGISGAVEDTSIEEAELQMQTNFLGTVRVIQAALPSMRQRRRGTIINTTSVAGQIALPFQAFYCASKFATEGFSEALRMEVRPFGIRVVLVQPGDHATGFTEHRIVVHRARGDSPYKDRFNAVMRVVEHDEHNAPPPDKIAELVLRILRAKSPNLFYSTGLWMQRMALPLKKVLPSRAFEAIIRTTYKA